MSQSVNLYQPALLEPRQPRSTRLMLLAFALTVIVLVIYYILTSVQTISLKNELRALSSRQAAVAGTIAQLQLAAAPQKSPLLQREVDRMAAELAAKRPLVELFKAPQRTVGRGFSPYLQGLARRAPEGLWLRHILLTMEGGRSALEGSALRPELVPQFLQSMNVEEVFAGMDFAGFRLLRPETGGEAVEFFIETGREVQP
ncbi:PilN domain-containing protein [Trichloromonas sp.]|uniref:PilN domain-containing protein n=1 Tax=Trichloromonas sp. TaxID=3069249 RepID=UPI003D819B76